MNSTTVLEAPFNWRKLRRKYIKRFGKRFLRRMAAFQGGQSLVGDAPLIPKVNFPFLRMFEDHADVIHREVLEILKHREAIPCFQEVSTDQKKIATGSNWRTFMLYGFGAKVAKNYAAAPQTSALLESVPHLQSSWFSILAPGYHIPAHCGVTKGILRAHLGLIIPREAERCRIRIGEEFMIWRKGEVFVFDDTYSHEVWNDTSEERVILIIDFDRPMRFFGTLSNKIMMSILKMTAFYQEPKKKMKSFEDRFEAAVLRANQNVESLSGDH